MEKGIKKVSVLMKQIIYWTELIAGGFLTVCFVAVTISYITEGQGLDLILVGAAFAAVMFFMTRNGYRGSRLIVQYKKYSAILAVDDERSLAHLASVAQVPADKLQKQIEQMIKRGYFGSAYINYDTLNLVLVDDELAPEIQSASRWVQDTCRYRSVVCPSCGAANKVAEGTVGECEFCGSPLEADRENDEI